MPNVIHPEAGAFFAFAGLYDAGSTPIVKNFRHLPVSSKMWMRCAIAPGARARAQRGGVQPNTAPGAAPGLTANASWHQSLALNWTWTIEEGGIMSTTPSGPRAPYLSRVTQAIDTLRQELVDISLDIHAHPELNYQERHAAKLLADALERHGFQVELGI